LLLFISLSTQSGNFWTYSRISLFNFYILSFPISRGSLASYEYEITFMFIGL